jgi:thioredoxin-like negative regulator of GroEL
MTKEFYILLALLLITGFGTAGVIFFHDDTANSDPMVQLQQEVCLKLRQNAIKLFQRHELFESEAELRRLLKLDPENREMMLLFGRILFETGRVRESGEIFRHIMALSPIDTGARNNLAVIMASEGKFEAAERELISISDRDSIRRIAPGNLAAVRKAAELAKLGRRFAIVPETGKTDFRVIGAISVRTVELHPENKSK